MLLGVLDLVVFRGCEGRSLSLPRGHVGGHYGMMMGGREVRSPLSDERLIIMVCNGRREPLASSNERAGHSRSVHELLESLKEPGGGRSLLQATPCKIARILPPTVWCRGKSFAWKRGSKDKKSHRFSLALHLSQLSPLYSITEVTGTLHQIIRRLFTLYYYNMELDMEAILATLRRFSLFETLDVTSERPAYEAIASARITDFFNAKKALSLLLPAFPWKNPNKDKTLSLSPDFGEELALARLNHLCEELAKVYPFGASLTIVADGPVYNGKLQYESRRGEIICAEERKEGQ